MRKSVFGAMLLLAAVLGMQTAHAEYFGMVNGRGGDLRNMADLSLEAGFVTGDYGPSSYDLIGVRLNYRLIPGLIAYADLGQSDVTSYLDGTSLGFGAYYQLQDLIPSLDVSIKASYHKLDLSGLGISTDLDGLSVELVLSGQEALAENGLSWYANTGIHRLGSNRASTETEPGIGAGMVLPLGPGEVFFGADYIDEIMFGAGFRFALR